MKILGLVLWCDRLYSINPPRCSSNVSKQPPPESSITSISSVIVSQAIGCNGIMEANVISKANPEILEYHIYNYNYNYDIIIYYNILHRTIHYSIFPRTPPHPTCRCNLRQTQDQERDSMYTKTFCVHIFRFSGF